jgi:hypothetical protein
LNYISCRPRGNAKVYEAYGAVAGKEIAGVGGSIAQYASTPSASPMPTPTTGSATSGTSSTCPSTRGASPICSSRRARPIREPSRTAWPARSSASCTS